LTGFYSENKVCTIRPQVFKFSPFSVAVSPPAATTSIFLVVLFAKPPRLDAASATASAPFAFVADAEVSPAANLDVEASDVGKL
jgi:hypothetical protein